ncbi:MAG: hypothetical protein GY940_12170 [bacterium]|nr:hypothetical protein [bacterium]
MGKKNREEQFLLQMEKLLGAAEACQLVEALDRRSPKAVRYNRNLCSPDELKGTSVPWYDPYGCYWEGEIFPSRTLQYAAGKYYIQEASAMLAISAASGVIDFNDKIVLDLTAAPGGKTTQAAELIGSGYMVANEVIRKRVDALTWNVNRHRLNNVVTMSLPTETLAEWLPGLFDVVIVDAPCSGEGLFQRKKHSPVKWSEKNVRFCARRQQSILNHAMQLVRPEGYLVYSTCTFSREENEDQVAYLLGRGFAPVALPGRDALPVSPAITGDEAVASCSRRIFPHRETGAGAFVSVVRNLTPSSGAADFSRWQFHHSKTNSLEKIPYPFLRSGETEGFFYDHNGVVGYFSHPRVPKVVLENSFQIGAPLFDKRRGNDPMFGCTQLAVPETLISLEPEQAMSYIHGEELRLDDANGYHLVESGGMILGPVKISSGRAVNRLPKPLRVV